MDISQLPDDILAHIFARLSPRELLGSVRAVCHRWRDLAVQRHVWRAGGGDSGLSVDSNYSGDRDRHRDNQLAVRALSLPLYLSCLQVNIDFAAYEPTFTRLLKSTPCAVETLRIELGSWGKPSALAMRMMRRLEPHLRGLILDISWPPNSHKSKARKLLQACVGMRGLTYLHICVSSQTEGVGVWSKLDFTGPPSLKEIGMHEDVEAGLVGALLRAHSATLVRADFTFLFSSLSELKALAECSQLSKLQVPAGLGCLPKVLARLPAALTDLTIYCWDDLPESYRMKRGWTKYFSNFALRLTSLTFVSGYQDEFNPTVWRLVLAAVRGLAGLASTGGSALRVLTLNGYVPDECVLDEKLALAGLPHLEEICFLVLPRDDVLVAILEEVPPRLHTVRTLSEHRGCKFGGALEIAQRLLQRHPHLHIVNVGNLMCPHRERVQCCDVAGHMEQRFGVLAPEHPPSYACVLCARYSAREGVHWIRLLA